MPCHGGHPSTAGAPTKLRRSQLPRDERGARELVKRIRKLRWMGMDEEARRLQRVLSRIPPGESVLLLPPDTD
jgi:hypothetical protein